VRLAPSRLCAGNGRPPQSGTVQLHGGGDEKEIKPFVFAGGSWTLLRPPIFYFRAVFPVLSGEMLQEFIGAHPVFPWRGPSLPLHRMGAGVEGRRGPKNEKGVAGGLKIPLHFF